MACCTILFFRLQLEVHFFKFLLHFNIFEMCEFYFETKKYILRFLHEHDIHDVSGSYFIDMRFKPFVLGGRSGYIFPLCDF